MITSLRLPFQYDVAALRESLDAIPQNLWEESNSRYVSRDTYFIGELIEPQPGQFDEDEVPIFDFKTGVPVDSVFREIRKTIDCVLESFRLTRLLPNAEIRPHRDFMYGFEHGLVRLHIPIVSNSGSQIYFETGETVVMNDGECWYADFAVQHHLKNSSEHDRYHLVMDCRVNDWCKELITRPSPSC